MIVLGLGHRMRSGKDTCAKYIAGMYGSIYNIRLYSFAEELKKEINQMYEWHGSWDAVFSLIHNHITPLPDWVVIQNGALMDTTDPLCPYGKQRQLLQFWGMYRREESPNYWVKKLAARVKEENPQVAIITDVRMPNEFKWVKSFGRDGITVKVSRSNYEVNENSEHISEKALDDFEFDYEIKAGSLEELKSDSEELFEVIRSRDVIPEDYSDWRIENES